MGPPRQAGEQKTPASREGEAGQLLTHSWDGLVASASPCDVTHAVTPTPIPGHSPEEAPGNLRLCPVSAAMRPCVPVKTVGLSELLQEGGLGGADSEAGGEFPHDGEASHQAAPQGPAEAPSRPLAEQRPFASLHLLLPRPPVTCCGFQGGEGALEKKLRAWWLLSGARDKARAGTRA